MGACVCYICSPTRLFNFFNGYRNYLGFLLLEFILFYFSKYVTFFSFPPGSSLILFYCLSCDSDIVDLQRCACFSCTTPWIGYCKHIYPLSWTSLPPSPPPAQVITEQRAQLAVLCGSFPLAVYFTHGRVYILVLLSQVLPTLSTSPFSMSASLFLPWK